MAHLKFKTGRIFFLPSSHYSSSMNIALVGYGKMGHVIERLAEGRGHKIVLRITSANRQDLDKAHLELVDVAIEFTNPESALANVLTCLDAGVAVICGTTGWNRHLAEAEASALEQNTAFLYASNFSPGVNIFFEINKRLAALMNSRPEYDVTIEETHHTHKKDAPSGTAITLAEQITTNIARKKGWILNDYNEPNAIPILAQRIDEVPGTHKVTYSSAIDSIDIIHTAHNREGFALGAVLAAEYIKGKEGIFSMSDVLFDL